MTAFLTSLNLAAKISSLLACVMAECCSDLILLHNNSQHLFLLHHAAIFGPAFVCNMYEESHFHLKFVLNLISMLILALCLYEGLLTVY